MNITIWGGQTDLAQALWRVRADRDKREAVYRGMYLGGDQALTSREWMETNIRQGHGPLGVLYPTRTWTAPNPHSAIKEGDTPSWFYFLPNGLNVPDQPTWGGWNGRFVQSSNHIHRDGRDTVDTTTDGRCTVWRWRDTFVDQLSAGDPDRELKTGVRDALAGVRASACVRADTLYRERMTVAPSIAIRSVSEVWP